MLCAKDSTLKFLIFTLFFSFSASVYCGAVAIPRSDTVNLTEKSTSRVYPLYIKTPRSYSSNTDKTYPVIYLMDAPYAFQLASGATRFPMNSGVMSEAIIVGIAYSKGSKGASSRIRDFTPGKAINWQLETGNAEHHSRFIRDQVLPFVEKNYRASAANKTFVGNSLGGLFGAYILLKHPDMFNSYILGSPSVWFNNNQILALPAITPTKPTKVYLSVGSMEQPSFGENEDMVAGARKLALKIDQQENNNITLNFQVITGAKHATAFPTTLIQGLDWIYGG